MNWNGKNIRAYVDDSNQRGIVIMVPALVASQLAMLIERAERSPSSALRAAPRAWAGVGEVKNAIDFLLIERERPTDVPDKPAPWPRRAELLQVPPEELNKPEPKTAMTATEALRAFHKTNEETG
jgi:hypothetical protein